MTVINAVTAFRPTDHYARAKARGRAAAQAVRDRGGSAIDVAIEQIRVTFDDRLRADTMAAFKLSKVIADGDIPSMDDVREVLEGKQS